MSTATVLGVVRQLGLAEADPETDSSLLTRYVRSADHTAFAELLRRHGPVVFGACRRVLNDVHDAEDAFQATFLVLAVKAGTVRPPGSVGGWLYGVAVNVARKAKVAAARRWRREMATVLASGGRQPTVSDPDHADLRAVIDEELGRLPTTLRDALVLCDLNDKTRSEAAKELGWPEGTVAARLHKARKLLAERLTRRGVTLPAAGFAAILTPDAVSASLVQSTLAAASSFVADAASTLVSPTVRTLAEGVMRMSTGKLKLAFAVLAIGLLTGGGLLWGANPASETNPTPAVEVAMTPAKAAPPNAEEYPSYVHSIAYSPDGKRFVVSPGISVRDPSGKVLYTVPGEAAGFSADSKTLIVMGAKSITIHDAESGKKLKLHEMASGKDEYSHPRPKTNLGWHQVAFSPDGKRYAAHFGFNARVYDTATGFEPVRLEEQHEPGSTAFPATVGKEIKFSPDGKHLAAVGVLMGEGKMGAAVWDAETGKRLHAFEADFTDGPKSIAFSPDGKQIAVGFAHKAVLYDVATFKELRQVPTLGMVSVVAYTPNSLIALGCEAKLSDGKQPPTDVRRIVVHIDDPKRDFGSSAVLDYGNEVGKTTLPLSAMAFSPDGMTLVMGTGYPNMTSLPENAPKLGGALRVFPLDGSCREPIAHIPWREKAVLTDAHETIFSVAFNPDGQWFAAGGDWSGAACEWHYPSLEKNALYTYDDVRSDPAAVCYSPDGKIRVTTFRDGVYWSERQGLIMPKQMQEKGSSPRAVAYGPYGDTINGKRSNRLALTDGRAVWVKMWFDDAPVSTASFGPLKDAPKVEGPLSAAVAFSPDGKQLVFIPNHKIDPDWIRGKSKEKKEATHWFAQVWGGGSGVPMAVLPHGTEPVTAVAWSNDGKRIATGGAEGDVVLWDAKTFEEVKRVRIGGRNGRSRVYALAFGPGDRTLAAAVEFEDGKNIRRVRFLDPATGETVQDLQHFALTPRAIAFAPDGKTMIVGTGAIGAERPKYVLDVKDWSKVGAVHVFTNEPAK